MVNQLTLTNFRNHRQSAFTFQNLTLLVGQNGSGKTNVLEAISLLSTTRSWRTKSDVEVVQWRQPFARVEVDNFSLVIQRQPYVKQFAIGGVKRSAKEMLGSLKTVLFEPEDLQMVSGSPAARRHWLNVVLAQSDRSYGESLLSYQHVLTQRNKLLKRIRDGKGESNELHFWDQELVRLGHELWQKRSAFIALAKQELPRYYRDISHDDTSLTIRLETHPADRERLAEELVAVREREIIFGQTVRGPHRDDVIFSMGEIPMKERASRGEVRSLTLALKLIELDYLSNSTIGGVETASGEVLLLLDDVMSELDHERRKHLVEVTRKVQTIITTTDVEDLPPQWRDEATVIKLDSSGSTETTSSTEPVDVPASDG